jgi:superfamily II DNA or RNA helicase
MIIDNEKGNTVIDKNEEKLKVFEWISKYNEEGDLDIVSGYFTIGALAYISEITKEKIKNYRFVFGDIVNTEEKIKNLDLLNENLSIDNSLRLNQLAKEAVEFLKLSKVELKTLEPNFCHAKLYLKRAKTDDRNNYFITGSSNLTEAGIGKKETSNVELNIAESGNNNQYKELLAWFKDLWNRPQARITKTFIEENGKRIERNFKEYLIEEISRLFAIYTPEQIYFKILFELFNNEQDDPEIEKQLIRLEDTKVYNKLYDFQKFGVKSLVRMLNKYNGAILADAVGLGKTWSALSIMKSFQLKGSDVILLCPKKLEQNWTQYLKRNNSIFEEDQFDYVIKFHTDMREGGLASNTLSEDFFTNDKPKLIVIDESHNLRNDKASRYEFLVEEILKKSRGDIKVLLLSATPINNSFKDIRNQFKLITKGEENGFAETLDVANLKTTFGNVQKVFKEWSNEENAKLSDFHSKIKESAFFRLTDHLLVARTRKHIKNNFDNNLLFPKHKLPQNIFKTPMEFGEVNNFAEFMESMDLSLSAYLPSTYLLTKEERIAWAKEKSKDVTKDSVQREHYLVKMMMILLLKRLESSWYSFKITAERILKHHENALSKIEEYQKLRSNQVIEIDGFEFEKDVLTEQDELELQMMEAITLGKKNPINLSMLDQKGTLNEFKEAIQKDKETLIKIVQNISKFQNEFEQEKDSKSSKDSKLEALMEILQKKNNSENKKIIIFSVYKDTIEYLYTQLIARGFKNIAMVSGDENKIWNETTSIKKHEEILERFAPYTKLFKAKNWSQYDKEISYHDWKVKIVQDYPKIQEKLSKPIDILLATDVLSEGQNLQDADTVVNYDIHWNPVRVIQRVGRIDRIGSINNEIQCINFWPAKDIDDYINLKARVEKRMAIMKLAGSEVIDEFTDDFKELAEAENLEDQQNANLLIQMKNSMEELDGEDNLGFDDFSFDNYRQLLQSMLNQKKSEFTNMPKGVFSGVELKANPDLKKGIITLLGYPSQKKYDPNFSYLSHELIYIDEEGNQISNNQKVILEQLSTCYKSPRFVPDEIDNGDEIEITKWSKALKIWIDSQVKHEQEIEDGTKKDVMSDANLDFVNRLKNDAKATINKLNKEGNVSTKYNFNNFDLITWLIIS